MVPGLKHDMADPDVVELVGIRSTASLEIRDARADHHTVDRRAGLAGLLHQPLAADLKLPQVRVEEKGIGTGRSGPGSSRRDISWMRL
ncbi:hypothetical protein [Mycobacterium kansasii]|uniref:hypothetical protein n=1 Tax=Mycobacterium kansasii TaxID=1768 RepID=UPI00267874F3